MRLTEVSSPAGTFDYNYWTPGGDRVQDQTVPNRSGTALIHHDYDDLWRLTQTTLSVGQDVVNQHAYAYDAGNQRTQQVWTVQNTISHLMNYTYDPIGQLTSAQGFEGDGVTPRLQEQFGYGYDKGWNLQHRTNNALVQTFNVNSVNALTTVTRSGTLTVAGTTTSAATNVAVNALDASLYGDATFAKEGFSLADGNNTFSAVASDALGRRDTNSVTVNLPSTTMFVYDLNGNLRTNGTRVFDYDDENQLIRITEPGAWKSEFSYDGLMRRRVRKEFTWSSALGTWQQTNEVRYVYDMRLVIQERDASNLPQVSYTRGMDLSGSLEDAGGIGGLLARIDHRLWAIGDSRACAYYHCDGNGNITALVDTNGQIAARYTYDPYGNVLSMNGPLASANLYRFSSKEQHANSGMTYYLHRLYSPNLQRWQNRDPLREGGGLNLYASVANDPVNKVDPVGLTFSSNWDFFWNWALGQGQQYRCYGPETTETREMAHSPGGQALRNAFYKNTCNSVNGFTYGTGQAAWDTLLDPFTADWTGTGAQVGGYAGASAINNGDGTVTFTIPNVAGIHSFFYHIVPNRTCSSGPGRNIYQTFQWSEKIDKSRSECWSLNDYPIPFSGGNVNNPAAPF